MSDHERNPQREAPGKPGLFPTTRWSLVLHADAGSESQIRAALERLCQLYWFPLYAYVRREGRSHHEAQDCTQAFFMHLLAAAGVARARPERGRFRSYLLTALRHFLIDEWRRANAAMRGGGQPVLPLKFNEAETRIGVEPVDPGLTPEQVYDRDWARDMIDRAIATLRADYEDSGRGALFAALAPLMLEVVSDQTVAQKAEQLGHSLPATTMALHRMRRRLGERLRAEVAETVDDTNDVDAELQYLIAAVGRT
ncbi:MAG: sigma-70 family RNA polymerase sigma factor [Opitutus sp.]